MPDRPEIRPESSRARQMQSGNHNLAYRFPPIFGEDLLIAGVTATELGAPPAAEGVAAWVAPLLRAWAPDAAPSHAYFRMPPRFGRPPVFDPDATKDEAAMRDPASRGSEERTGRDHFLGFVYADAYPSSTWDCWNNFDDDVPAFEFPRDTRWEAEFELAYAGKPVWRIGVPTGGGFGAGLVDALTGEVVRFHRVTRRHTATVTPPDLNAPRGAACLPSPPPSESP